MSTRLQVVIPSVPSKKFLKQLQHGNLEFLIIPNTYMTIYLNDLISKNFEWD
jgi:hypothetical protein